MRLHALNTISSRIAFASIGFVVSGCTTEPLSSVADWSAGERHATVIERYSRSTVPKEVLACPAGGKSPGAAALAYVLVRYRTHRTSVRVEAEIAPSLDPHVGDHVVISPIACGDDKIWHVIKVLPATAP